MKKLPPGSVMQKGIRLYIVRSLKMYIRMSFWRNGACCEIKRILELFYLG